MTFDRGVTMLLVACAVITAGMLLHREYISTPKPPEHERLKKYSLITGIPRLIMAFRSAPQGLMSG